MASQRPYSTQFILGEINVSVLSYTVPAGFVAVLRDISVGTFHSTGGDSVTATLDGYIIATISAGAGPYTSGQWQGRVVMNSGQTLSLSTGADIEVVASGYLLSAP